MLSLAIDFTNLRAPIFIKMYLSYVVLTNILLALVPTVTSKASSFRTRSIHDVVLQMEDVSNYSDLFLSDDVNTLPIFREGDAIIYRLEIEEPSPYDETMNAARKYIGETPEAVENAKKQLINLLKKDSRLKAPVENDAWLLRFLRVKKYNAPMTYELIKGYYRFKIRNRSAIFNGLLPSSTLKSAETNEFTILPRRDQLGRRIFLFRAAKWKPEISSIIDGWKLAIVLTEMIAYEPGTEIAGNELIFDLRGLNWQHIRQFNPFIARKVIQWYSSLPIRIEGIHVVNEPLSRMLGILFGMFKPFLTKDLMNKIYFHGGNMKSLHRHISASFLPDIYGGPYKLPNFSSYEWDIILKSMDEEYKKIDSYGYKSKRRT